MARGRRTFDEAFDPYLQNTASMISRMLIGNSEREKDYVDWQKREDYKKKTEADQLQSQTDALAKYQEGGETVLTGVPNILGTKPTKSNFGLDVNIPNQEPNVIVPKTKTAYRNYSPSERIKQGLLAGVTSNEILNDLKPPKPQDIYEGYIEKRHKTLARNKYTGQIETIKDWGKEINPGHTPKWDDREIPNSFYKGKDGRFYKRVGKFDYNENVWNENEKGEKVISKEIRIPLTKSGTNGEKLFSKEITQNFNQYQKNIDTLLTNINLGVDPETGTEATQEQINDWKTQLSNESTNYSNIIKNTASSRFTQFYKDLYNGTDGKKKAKTNALPLVFWNKLMTDGKKYGFTPKDYQSGYRLFISTYKADPLELYGTSGFEDYFEEDNNNDINEEEL